MIVLDTGVLVAALLGAVLPLEISERAADGALAQDVVIFEALSVMRRLDERREVPTAALQQAVEDLERFPLIFESSMGLRRVAWQLRKNITAADALFVSLAKEIGVPLATTDARLVKSARKHAGIDVIHMAA